MARDTRTVSDESLLSPTPSARATDTGPAGVDTQFLLARARARLLGWPQDEPPVVGRYRVTRRLGEGGMSVVYAALDDALDREVAIKFLHTDLATTASWRDRLRREALAMARLPHPNVVHVYEVGEHEGQAYLVMEFVPGTTLRAWARVPRSTTEILAMHRQAGRGLAAAHEAGIVHRDYKPDNVLVDDGGHARVLDFGLARAGGDDPLPESSVPGGDVVVSVATTVGTLMGTPSYMAPEQLAGLVADARSDQFSFCVALFEALHGARPFVGDDVAALSASMQSERLREPDPSRPEVPPAIDAVLRRGLALRPEDRFASMPALLQALTDAEAEPQRTAQAELTRKAEALDFTLRSVRRWQHSVGIGVAFAVVVAVLFALRVLGIHEVGYADSIGVGIALVGLQLHSQLRMIRAGANEIDRRWARMMTAGSGIVSGGLAFSWLAGLDLTMGFAVTSFAAATASTTVILLVDARALISTACLYAMAIALVLAPSLRAVWLVLGLFGAYASLWLVWRRA